MEKPRLIYYNDSRHHHFYRYDPPMSLHRLQQPVDELVGTSVDTLSYGLATGLTFLHDTRVGTRFGELAEKHGHGVVWWRAAENLKQALAAGHDPLKVVVDRAHQKGIRLICSMRINDTGAPGESDYTISRLKCEHPELMIGEEDPDNPLATTAYDFARPEVRRERLAIIEEVCDRYGADGFEIDDYIRVFFKASEVKKNTPLLTDWVREVRDLLDRIGKKRGEELLLAARVHPLEEANLAVGMDVRAWLSEGLVNLVIPHLDSPTLNTNLSLGWLPEVAHEAGAWVFSPVGREPYDDRHHVNTVEMFRAASMNFRAAGADGLYLSDLPFPRTDKEYMILREMGDPDTHARKSKHYYLEPQGRIDPHFPSKRDLPVELEEGVSAPVAISIGDSLDAARADGELERVTLGVRIESTCPEDRLSFRFNGIELSLDSARIDTFYGGIVSYMANKLHANQLPIRINTHYWFEFDLPLDLAREGENQVEVRMDRHFRELTAVRVLYNVEVRVSYRDLPLPVEGQM